MKKAHTGGVNTSSADFPPEHPREPKETADTGAAVPVPERSGRVDSVSAAVFGFKDPTLPGDGADFVPTAKGATPAGATPAGSGPANTRRKDSIAPPGSEGTRGPTFFLASGIGLWGLVVSMTAEASLVQSLLGWLFAAGALILAGRTLAQRMRYTDGPISRHDTAAASLTIIFTCLAVVLSAWPLTQALMAL
ncbi:hypothetical protein SAMN05421878_11622 [Actinobaculum suis]|uniref:Uncharacterized protein n=1 Tax=Actinobaculum suis TaxID=1657 RepID=A0A1G7EAQ4_9ACTO|nr:hypothetical protein SAMN05421878_11622 [Actinobaculum suis]